MKGTIVYFVDDIATSFVIKDIRMMSARYEKVVLFSVDKIEERDLLPSNVILVDEFMNWKLYDKKKILFAHLFSILKIYFNECRSLKRLLPLKTSIALIASNIFKSQEIDRHLKDLKIDYDAVDVFYSFWFYDCIYLAWMKSLNPKIKIITRTHSGDLYEDHISIRDRLLFRHFQMSRLNAVYPVSDMGTAYLQKIYPKHKEKFKTIFLGTENYNCLNPFDPNHLVIVSCASFRHHKRIHRIAEALLDVNRQVTWYHFGNENLHTSDPKIPEYIQRKKQLESKPNVNFIPMGFTDNADLMDFYKKTPVSLFISLSAAEGIPVSIMEAISFGIPVLSTDVGGCAEIVNGQTGLLIPLETDMKSISAIIDGFPESPMNTEGFRHQVREFWKMRFDADDNYKYFFENLKSI